MKALASYTKKRRFKATPEPTGKDRKARTPHPLQFVVQRHDASHLHYDFRLEAAGVLKSWAIPKGPSMNPKDKRLAVLVEDHPLEYGKFQGRIPKGNYGAGSVEIWDSGTYEPDGGSEKEILAGIEKGSLKFRMNGGKLRGSFALVRLNDGKNKNWLLIKHKDEFATASEFRPDRSRDGEGVKIKEDGKKADDEKGMTVSAGGQTVHLTHLSKEYWPEEHITKGELINYYQRIANYILPHLKNRPQSLKRNPNGIAEAGFFHKDAGLEAPDWVQNIPIYSESTKRETHYIICNDAATLAYLNNLGCIEINPWNSTVQHLDNPDYLVLDIDPSANTPFDDVIDAALAIRDVLAKAKAKSFCKTSGASGMHLYVPFHGTHSYDELRPFAELIAALAHQALPDTTTLERSLSKRKGKIYLDYLQNSKGQTLASAYSVRPVAGACVSAPLAWTEVKHGLRPLDFTIASIEKRLAKKGDLFKEVLTEKTDLARCIRLLESR